MFKDEVEKFKKTLDIFTVVVNELESRAAILEGRVENLGRRKEILERECEVKVTQNDTLLRVEKDRIKYLLSETANLFKDVQTVLYDLQSVKAHLNFPAQEKLDAAVKAAEGLKKSHEKLKDVARV